MRLMQPAGDFTPSRRPSPLARLSRPAGLSTVSPGRRACSCLASYMTPRLRRRLSLSTHQLEETFHPGHPPHHTQRPELPFPASAHALSNTPTRCPLRHGVSTVLAPRDAHTGTVRCPFRLGEMPSVAWRGVCSATARDVRGPVRCAFQHREMSAPTRRVHRSGTARCAYRHPWARPLGRAGRPCPLCPVVSVLVPPWHFRRA
ncbi:hypothetical protein SAMN05661093_02469 [Kibdelosporangium aridum]|uniref:Uncharacterized protein n=1 Tax=Kibdelosporangium aridum TaxID=2030 RepID=A0A1W2CU72_KIBAR|nr:hypothetical protein SAMN05661093_02469 [Kibdelosporangium aridum]